MLKRIKPGLHSDHDEPKSIKRYEGLTLKNAQVLALKEGRPCRITRLDGVPQMGTTDAISNRVNFHVVKGKVVKAYLG